MSTLLLLGIPSFLLFGAFLAQDELSFSSAIKAERVSQQMSRIAKLRGVIVHLDEVLTMSARMAAATGEARWQARYEIEAGHLDEALVALAKEVSAERAEDVRATASANQELVRLEQQAFAFVRDNRSPEAVTLLEGEAYAHEKASYSRGMKSLEERIDAELRSATEESRARVLFRRNFLYVAATVVAGFWLLGLFSVLRLQERDYRSQQELAQKATRLAQSNAELAQFAYVASHDLREPLRAVAVYSQRLADENRDTLSPQSQKYLEFLLTGAERMQLPVADLLTYTRLDAELPIETIDMNQLVKSVINDHTSLIDAAHAEIEVPELPDIVGRPSQISQVVSNLLSNAIKFRSHMSPTIKISSQASDAEWQFAVQDDGIGIADRHLKQIFDVLKRLHSSKEFKGTGIGLAVCLKVVQRHGGRIWVESEPGVGSTFFFTIARSQGES